MKLVAFLVAISALLYTFFLQNVPVHFNQDELGFSLNAYSIATTGFDENGRFMPLYFWHLGVMWSTPIIVYLTAVFLKIFPLSEATIRFPSILIGIIDILLIYFLAKRIFGKKELGIIAAVFLALTPPHFMHSRLLLDNLYIVPFMLGWLLLLHLFVEKRELTYLFLATILLGVGIHSYHAAKIMMSLYLLITLIFLAPEIKRQKSIMLVAILGFLLPLIPLIPWLQQYPDTLTDQIRYTGLYNTRLAPLEGIRTLLTWENFVDKSNVFINYFNPSFLFLTGDLSLIHSTRQVGIFLLSYLILLPLGFVSLLKERSKRWGILFIVGFFISPFAPSLVGNQYRVSKELVILPFAAMIAIYGFKLLYEMKVKLWKTFSMILVLVMILQFGSFLTDYFGNYRFRSYSWFNYNIPGSLENILEDEKRNPVDSIYLDKQVNFIDRYWKFYSIKYGNQGVLSKTYYVDPTQVNSSQLPKNSILLYRFDHQPIVTPLNIKTIQEPDGTASFYEIYTR